MRSSRRSCRFSRPWVKAYTPAPRHRGDPQLPILFPDGARGRSRTGTDVTVRGILSPLRLPVPPPGRLEDSGNCIRKAGAAAPGYGRLILMLRAFVAVWEFESVTLSADGESIAVTARVTAR